MNTIYRFYWYNSLASPNMFLLRYDNDREVQLMGWSRFLDLCLDSIMIDDFNTDDCLRIDKTWQQVFVDMDRLRQTNFDLYNKVTYYLNQFDDLWLTTDKVCNLLDELEKFIRGKIVE